MRGLRLLAVLALGAACSRGSGRDCAELAQERPVDPTLLAFLSRARAAHHAADAAELNRDPARALRLLGEVSAGPLPPGTAAQAPEVREVLADTLARQADLTSQAGAHDDAEQLIDRGLELVPTPTYFRGHLYEIRGLSEERRAAALQTAGDTAGAELARARALDALERAMKIQASVILQPSPSEP